MEVTLYVGNLSPATDEDEIENLFTHVGQVIRLRLQRDPRSGRSRGFGYLTMSAQSEADHAVSQFNDLLFNGNRLKVSLARRRTGSGASRPLFGR